MASPASSSSRFPCFEPSKLPRERLRFEWERWIRGLEIYLQSLKVNDPEEKKIQFLARGGLEIQDKYYEREPAPPIIAGENEDRENVADLVNPYQKAKQILAE